MNKYKILLGSQSPRRSELLTNAGYEISIKVSHADEYCPNTIPTADQAEYISRLKAEALLPQLEPGQFLITADSIVVIGNETLGKPNDADHAKSMLRKLSNRVHQVYTGISIYTLEKQYSFTELTEVCLDVITDVEIDNYIREFSPFDKAGSYGIQDWVGIAKVNWIKGSYTNVMGIPVAQVTAALQDWVNKPHIPASQILHP